MIASTVDSEIVQKINYLWNDFVQEIDWESFRDQKESLEETIAYVRKSKLIRKQNHYQSLSGILDILNKIQKIAAIELGGENVFGICSQCGEDLKNFMIQTRSNSFQEIHGCPQCDS